MKLVHIGKRYRRQDEIGTPYCVTVDHETFQDETVTLRDRDSMEQVRLPISGLLEALKERLEETTSNLTQSKHKHDALPYSPFELWFSATSFRLFHAFSDNII